MILNNSKLYFNFYNAKLNSEFKVYVCNLKNIFKLTIVVIWVYCLLLYIKKMGRRK